MSIVDKTIFKLKVLFTDPRQFFQILKNVFMAMFFPAPLPEGGQRFTTDMETLILRAYATRAKLGVVEIGILDGATTREMAQVCKVPIYGIDPLIPDSMNKRLIGHEEKIKMNLEFYPAFRFIKDFSFNVVKTWQGKFDFIFIDGDHTYEAVKQDFEQWLPLLENDGFVAFHDSATVTSIPGGFPGWPGPVRLVEELRTDARVNLVEVKDSITVFQKK